jgi:hypothetical protein
MKIAVIDFRPDGVIVVDGLPTKLAYGDILTLNKSWGITHTKYLNDLVKSDSRINMEERIHHAELHRLQREVAR